MDVLVVLGLMTVGALVVALARDGGPGRARAADWMAAAEASGLENAWTRHDGTERRLQASRGGMTISLAASTLFTVTGTTMRVLGLPQWLEIRPRSAGHRRLAGGRGLTVGDDHFDDAFEVRGQRMGVQALCDFQVRRKMAEMFGGARAPSTLVDVSEGRLIAQIDDGELATRAARLRELLRSLLALVDRLAALEEVEPRLAQSVQTDPHPRFRLRCLELLLQESPQHPATADAVRAALRDSDGRIRLAAALASPDDGRAVLLEVARDDASSDAVASRALAFVGEAIEGAELERILSAALAAGKEATVAACVEALARAGVRHLPVIVRVLESETAPRAAAAARALGATGTPTAGPALVRALAHAEAAVRAAAAASLGRVGATADDVLALRQAEAAHPWDGTFLRAAREAIASIQSRLVGADHGQLALAQPAGELSLADDLRGRVSRRDRE